MTKKKTPQTIEECNAEIEKLPVEWNSSSQMAAKITSGTVMPSGSGR